PLRLIRSVARPARRMGDLCRQVSWLAARTLRPAFPAREIWPVASVNKARRLQLRGQPRLEGSRSPLPCSLFTCPHNGQEPARQPNNQRCPRPSSAATPALSMLTALLRVRCRQATNRSPPAPL